jgi:hypothetical protein
MNKRLLFLPAILIGIIVGLAIGYIAYKATGGPLNFHGWMANEYFGNPVGAFQWAIGGVSSPWPLPTYELEIQTETTTPGRLRDGPLCGVAIIALNLRIVLARCGLRVLLIFKPLFSTSAASRSLFSSTKRNTPNDARKRSQLAKICSIVSLTSLTRASTT